MTDYLNNPVAYLEDSDFNEKGELINNDIPKNTPIVVMIQALYCGHCKNAKPAFQEFANATEGKVFCCTIQGDGDREGERSLAKRLDVIKPGFRGYPDYVLYFNGERVNKEITGRGVEDLEQFSNL